MTQAIHRYDGTVHLVTADGIAALFGMPSSHEDHAVRACYAALQIQEAVNRYTRGLPHILLAAALYRNMDMRFWLDRPRSEPAAIIGSSSATVIRHR
jgi:hypothetical protein